MLNGSSAVGSNLTLLSAFQVTGANGNLLNEALYDPTTNLVFVTVPSAPSNATTCAGCVRVPGSAAGLLAMRVLSNCSLGFAYVAKAAASSPYAPFSGAVLANGVVYYSEGPNKRVHAVAAANGTVLWSGTTSNAVYVAPTVVGGRVYAAEFATTTAPYLSLLHAWGLPGH